MTIKEIPTWFYRQFDADYSLDVPAEGYGGWKKEILPLNMEKTAIAVMHAWDCGTFEQYPGWYRAVEYIPRANKIANEVFPVLFSAARKNGVKIIHIADDSGYAEQYEGYSRTLYFLKKHISKQNGTNLPGIREDETLLQLKQFRENNCFTGINNKDDVLRGQNAKRFMKSAEPLANESIVINSDQLHAVCLELGVNHLIYCGFAINWCLQFSPGNMNDMSNRGILCSTIREAVTAVENKNSARLQSNKEYGLWVTALKNGFVYDLKDFLDILE